MDSRRGQLGRTTCPRPTGLPIGDELDMKIAVAATGNSIDAPCDPRFGRCAWFVIVDTDTLEWAALENSGAAAGSGAGIQAAQAVARAGAEAVIAGNYGPNASQMLAAGGIAAYVANPGMTVREAVQAFKEGRLQLVGGPTAPAHSGTASMPPGGLQGPAGPGSGPGAGMGRGRGQGMGGGRGRGGAGGGGMGGGRGYCGGRGRRGSS